MNGSKGRETIRLVRGGWRVVVKSKASTDANMGEMKYALALRWGLGQTLTGQGN